MSDNASIFLYRCLCLYCGSNQLCFEPLGDDDMLVTCMDCDAEYLQTEDGDHHRLPESNQN